MITNQKRFLLSMLAIFATTALHAMDQQENNQEPAQNNSIKDELLQAKKEFYVQKATSKNEWSFWTQSKSGNN